MHTNLCPCATTRNSSAKEPAPFPQLRQHPPLAPSSSPPPSQQKAPMAPRLASPRSSRTCSSSAPVSPLNLPSSSPSTSLNWPGHDAMAANTPSAASTTVSDYVHAHTRTCTYTLLWGSGCKEPASIHWAVACGALKPHRFEGQGTQGITCGGVHGPSSTAIGQYMIACAGALPAQAPCLGKLRCGVLVGLGAVP